MRRRGLLPFGLLTAGAALVVGSVLQGGAHIALIVIVPVIFGGTLEFGVGVLFLIAGMFSLPLALESAGDEELSSTPVSGPSPTGGSGGLVLVGPIPIFFGSWSTVSARTRLGVAVVGAFLVALAVALWLFYRG